MAVTVEISEITDAERIVLEKAALGEEVDLSGGEAAIDASRGGQWGEGREIRTSFLHALCTGRNRGFLPQHDGEALDRAWTVHTRGIQVRGAKITGCLDLSFAEFAHPLILRSCFFDGDDPLNFEQSRLPALALSGSHVPGIFADGLQTRGDVRLDDGFTAQRGVRLINAEIGGDLRCSSGTFVNVGGIALSAEGMEVAGIACLNGGFKADGEVRLLDARLGGLDCTGGTFINVGGIALKANRIKVAGFVFLNGGFKADGEVRLVDARLGGLACGGGTFVNPEGIALSAERAVIAGSVRLNERFKGEGAVCLRGAEIGSSLRCSDGTFGGQDDAFDGERLRVAGAFVWKPSTRPIGRVNLADARVGELRDGAPSWPQAETAAVLDGFIYDSFEEAGTAKYRLGWVRRYYSGDLYVPQPYEQLAAYFRRAGRDADARTVAIGKEHARRASLSWWRRPCHWLFGLAVGYGYRLWRALIPLVLLVAVGTALFARASIDCLVKPAYHAETCALVPTTDARELPTFQPVVYALDTVLPIIDLRQQNFWTPEGAYQWWFWLSITGGWTLSTAVAAGLTRAISKG
ncbi:MAG: hypothetical protein ACRDZ4_07525 [Egibacteraceae bacterium]